MMLREKGSATFEPRPAGPDAGKLRVGQAFALAKDEAIYGLGTIQDWQYWGSNYLWNAMDFLTEEYADGEKMIGQVHPSGVRVYDAIEKTIRLRYRLIPYLYSTAWQVTSANGSYLRPLFSDFAADKSVWDMNDEFMFGRSILAAPILDPQYTQEQIIREDAMTGWDKKEVKRKETKSENTDWNEPKTITKYLPKGALWYDFWTGKSYRGGQALTLQTSLDRVPMFVRAGSILPLGPEMQYTGEKPWDHLEIRIYPGADGDFTLYEDEGNNYNYERGVYYT